MRTVVPAAGLALAALGVALGGVTAAAATPPQPICLPPKCPTPTPTSTAPSPTPEPPPSLELSEATGSPGDSISVTGSYFGPDETIQVDWDVPANVLGATTADANGNFQLTVKIPNSAAGTHQICTVQQPQPCATFGLLAAQPSPSPSPSPTPSPSLSPSPSPVIAPSSVGGPTYPNGSDTGLLTALLTPPGVFLPLLLLIGAGALAAWWWRTRGELPALGGVRVTHSTGGEATGAAAGWTRPTPPVSPEMSEPEAGTRPEPEPPAGPWPWTGPGGDEPPDLPSPGD